MCIRDRCHSHCERGGLELVVERSRCHSDGVTEVRRHGLPSDHYKTGGGVFMVLFCHGVRIICHGVVMCHGVVRMCDSDLEVGRHGLPDGVIVSWCRNNV